VTSLIPSGIPAMATDPTHAGAAEHKTRRFLLARVPGDRVLVEKQCTRSCVRAATRTASHPAPRAVRLGSAEAGLVLGRSPRRTER